MQRFQLQARTLLTQPGPRCDADEQREPRQVRVLLPPAAADAPMRLAVAVLLLVLQHSLHQVYIRMSRHSQLNAHTDLGLCDPPGTHKRQLSGPTCKALGTWRTPRSQAPSKPGGCYTACWHWTLPQARTGGTITVSSASMHNSFGRFYLLPNLLLAAICSLAAIHSFCILQPSQTTDTNQTLPHKPQPAAPRSRGTLRTRRGAPAGAKRRTPKDSN